jgi:signal peptidase I
MNSKDSKPAAPPTKPKHGWDENIRTIIIAIVLALTFRSFAFEPFHIPSGSMKDTLLIGDYIFVSKYSYGYSRYSFPMGMPLFEGRMGTESRPARGDVVVFRLPTNPQIDFIKRVIGLPGDKIQMINGVLHINGLPVKMERAGEFSDRQEDGAIAAIRRYTETLPEGKQHAILDAIQNGEMDNTFVFTVPDKHYFMMGDNRDNSMDSRYALQVGFVPEENLIGRAEMIFFSVDDRTDIWKIWDWVWALRPDRFFKSIQ